MKRNKTFTSGSLAYGIKAGIAAALTIESSIYRKQDYLPEKPDYQNFSKKKNSSYKSKRR